MSQIGRLLDSGLATALQSALVALPEYCAPWELVEKINSGEFGPREENLWVFGFQGITFKEIENLERKCQNLVFEYDRTLSTTKGFTGPVGYIFRARHSSGVSKTVCVFQFKTCPMGDSAQFEKENLILGETFYILRNPDDDIRLMSLICADSLNSKLTENFRKLIPGWKDKAFWLLHLQMNSNPRNTAFKQYRDTEFGAVRTTEKKAILCLNWAQGSFIDGTKPNPQHYGLSALYLRENETKIIAGAIDRNHKLGVYYSYSEAMRSHALFFNFSEFSYHFSSAKLLRGSVPGALGTYNLPTAKNTHQWNGQEWKPLSNVDDLSVQLCPWRASTGGILNHTNLPGPLEREFIILNSTGYVEGSISEPSALRSIRLDSTEAIKRLTFLQDIHENAKSFREKVIGNFRELIEILTHRRVWPELLNKSNIVGHLERVDENPFFNLKLNNGESIFVAFVGNQSELEQKHLVSVLQDRYRGRNRKYVFLWKEDAGQLKNFLITDVKIDSSDDVDPTDIAGDLNEL